MLVCGSHIFEIVKEIFTYITNLSQPFNLRHSVLVHFRRKDGVDTKLKEIRFILVCRINLILIGSSQLQTIFNFLFLAFELWTKMSTLHRFSHIYLRTL